MPFSGAVQLKPYNLLKVPLSPQIQNVGLSIIQEVINIWMFMGERKTSEQERKHFVSCI